MNILDSVRRSCIALVAATLFSSTAFAQDAELIEAATEYANLPGVQKMIDDTFAPATFANQIRASLPPSMGVTQEQLDELGQLMAEKLSLLRPEMEQAMITGAARHFTLEEINALSEFYQSPLGSSIMTKMLPFFQETMSFIMPRMIQASQELSPEINRILGLDQ